MPNFGNTITVSVTADPGTGTLLVDGQRTAYQIDVNQDALVQIIEWNLQLTAEQSGSFNSIDPHSPTSGFSWTCNPKPGLTIFNHYERPNDSQITVHDQNSASSAEGDWSYKLCATVNGTPCQTNPPSLHGTPGDPKIRNR